MENGSIKVSTTSGTTFTSDNVHNELQPREERRFKQQEQQLAEAQEQSQQGSAEREVEQQQAQQRGEDIQKSAAHHEESELQRMKQISLSRYQTI